MSYDMNAFVNQFGNLSGTLQKVAGVITEIEWRMRLIGEKSLSVREKLENIQNEKNNKKEPYYKCSLNQLAWAIESVYRDTDIIKENELQHWVSLRNKFIHGDIAGLMKALPDGDPSGKMMYSDGSKNTLQRDNIQEAIMTMVTNQGRLQSFARPLCNNVKDTLDTILRNRC